MTRRPPKRGALPTEQEIRDFAGENLATLTVRELARAFGVRGDDRARLRALLRELRGGGRPGKGRPGLPNVAPIEVSEIDVDGELWGRPVSWHEDAPPPRIMLVADRRRTRLPALGVGDRVLARLKQQPDGSYEARVMRAIETGPGEIIGVYELVDGAGRVRPTERRLRHDYAVSGADTGGAQPGELVAAEPVGERRAGMQRVRVKERLGAIGSPRSLSLIAVHSHDIPTVFEPGALAEAEAGRVPPLGKREDLRGLPLVTIDPEDARDHDDAVWARPDPANPGGYEIVVAIADVAHYVRPGSALDHEAMRRGNSVYLPAEVVPMLPEALSAEACSLKPDEDRACLAVRMWIDAEGAVTRHKFLRGLMRSAANLTYRQVQAAADGQADAVTLEIAANVIAPLYAAHEALNRTRKKRDPLELDLPKRRIRFGEDGSVAGIDIQPHYQSHRLIEDMMIAANVCAAETLEAKRIPCLFRIHDEPDQEKAAALREFLKSLDYNLAKAQVLRPAAFNRILRRARGTPHEHLIHLVVLRAQAQACYAPDNIGHFGLSLTRYAHFTSPIRRYADILVHRGLIRACKLGASGLPDDAGAQFADIGERISAAERRAMAAEREAVDRITAAFLAGREGAVFSGRISGVSRFGLFVNLDETGADGLIPVRSLGRDYYEHDERRHALVGRDTGEAFHLGDPIEVVLRESDAISGRLRFELVGGGRPGDDTKPSRGRGKGHRRRR